MGEGDLRSVTNIRIVLFIGIICLKQLNLLYRPLLLSLTSFRPVIKLLICFGQSQPDRKIDRPNRKYLPRNFIIRQTESRKGRMSGILGAATPVLGETASRGRGREGRKSEEKDFPGDESSRGEGRTDILGWTEKRISEGRVSRTRTRRKRKEAKRVKEREGRQGGGRRGEQTGWRGRRTREERRRVGQFSLKISRRQWPKRARRRDVKGGCWELQAGRQAG